MYNKWRSRKIIPQTGGKNEKIRRKKGKAGYGSIL